MFWRWPTSTVPNSYGHTPSTLSTGFTFTCMKVHQLVSLSLSLSVELLLGEQSYEIPSQSDLK